MNPNLGRVEPRHSAEVLGQLYASSGPVTCLKAGLSTLCGWGLVTLRAMEEGPSTWDERKPSFLIESVTMTRGTETLPPADLVSSNSPPLLAACY